MAGDLRALAEEYVALQDKVEGVRRAMLACLTNGAGPNPTPAGRPGGTGSMPNHPNAVRAKEAEQTILAMLRERPRRAAEIATATDSRQSTTSERLRRMREKKLVTMVDGAWEAVSAAP
jgi:hypothetical protein